MVPGTWYLVPGTWYLVPDTVIPDTWGSGISWLALLQYLIA